MKINDRVYVLDTNTTDDHVSVLVIPATVKRIVRTEEETGESVSYVVQYDGARDGHHHDIGADNVVSFGAWDYDQAKTLGTAILAALTPTPKGEPKPKPDSMPLSALTNNTTRPF